MGLFHLGYNSQQCHSARAAIQVNGLPRLNLAHPLFPTLAGMFLVVPTSTTQELLVGSGSTSWPSWCSWGILHHSAESTKAYQETLRSQSKAREGCGTHTTTSSHFVLAKFEKKLTIYGKNLE